MKNEDLEGEKKLTENLYKVDQKIKELQREKNRHLLRIFENNPYLEISPYSNLAINEKPDFKPL